MVITPAPHDKPLLGVTADKPSEKSQLRSELLISEAVKYRNIADCQELTDVSLDFFKHGCRRPSMESRTKISLRGDGILLDL